MSSTSEPTLNPTPRGELLQRCYCVPHWRSHGERTIAVYRDVVVSECCGWTLPRNLVKVAQGFAEPTPKGRLEVHLARSAK